MEKKGARYRISAQEKAYVCDLHGPLLEAGGGIYVISAEHLHLKSSV